MKTDVKKLLLLFMSLFVCLGASAKIYLKSEGINSWNDDRDLSQVDPAVTFNVDGTDYSFDYSVTVSGLDGKAFKVVSGNGGWNNAIQYGGQTDNTASEVALGTVYKTTTTGSNNNMKFPTGCVTLYFNSTNGNVYIKGSEVDPPVDPVDPELPFAVKDKPSTEFYILGSKNNWSGKAYLFQEMQTQLVIDGDIYYYIIAYNANSSDHFKIAKNAVWADGNYGTSNSSSDTQSAINTKIQLINHQDNAKDIVPQSEIKYVFFNPANNTVYLWDGTTPLASEVTVTLNGLTAWGWSAAYAKYTVDGNDTTTQMSVSGDTATLDGVPSNYTAIAFSANGTSDWTTLDKSADNKYTLPVASVTLNLNGNNYTALWCKYGDEAAKAMTISNGVATLTVPAGYTGISIYDNEACTNLVKTFEKSADNTYTLDVAMTAITLNAAARGWSSAWVHYTYVDASVVTRATLIGATEMTSSGNSTYSAEIPATYTAILFSETKTGTQVTFDVNADGNYVLEEVPAEVWYVGGMTISGEDTTNWTAMSYDAEKSCWHYSINLNSGWQYIKFNNSASQTNAYGKTGTDQDYNLTLGTWYQTTSHSSLEGNNNTNGYAIWFNPSEGQADIWFNAETKRALIGDYFAYETPKEYGNYYLIGDINGVVDGTGKGWNLNDPAAKNNKWRFYKVNDEDVMVQAGKIDNNWYKLEVPASADGHNALCAQFKITDGQWNSDSNKGHEFTLDFDHGMQELGLSRTYYFRKYIHDNTAPSADQNSKYLYPYDFDAWGRIVELGMNKYTNTSSDKGTQWKGEPYEFENEEDFNNCVAYWSNELNTTIDEKIIKDYFDRYRTKAFDTTTAVDTDAATEIVSLRGGIKQYTANFHLDANRITPADGQKSVVIYFLPPTTDETTDGVTIRRGGKMFVYGKSQRLYFYYFNNEVEKERVKEVRVSVASSTNFNKGYYIDRATSMGPFELVNKETVGPDGKTYPYYWRKLMTRGYEDRHNQGDSFTAQFTTVIADESGVEKTTLSERKSISCGDVYLMDVKESYKVRFRYHPAAEDTRTISEVRMIVATPTAGDKALAVRSRTDAAVATETTVDDYSWDDSNYYPMTLVDKWYTTAIDSRMGSDYIVFRVTFSDNSNDIYYYDPYNRSQWIKMNNSDKDVHVYAAGEDNLNIGRLLVSHLSGDATMTDNIQLIIIPTVEDKEYYHYGHGGSYQYQYTDGTMFGSAQEYPMDDILYSYCITQDNTPEWQPWTNEPFKDVDLSSFAPGEYLIYAGVKYEDADIIHSVVADYTIADTSANKLHIESLKSAGTTDECGCEVPTIDNFIQGDVSKQHHMKLTIAGDLVGSGANVEWIKYDNGIRQGYYTKVNGEPVFNEVLPEHEASWMHKDGGTEYAHMTYNFGKVLYLAIVTPAGTPVPAPARAPRAANSIGTTPITLTNAVAKALHEANDHTTGIESVSADTEDAEPVYYNLQGVRVENPAAGHIYIEVRGTAVRKVRL